MKINIVRLGVAGLLAVSGLISLFFGEDPESTIVFAATLIMFGLSFENK